MQTLLLLHGAIGAKDQLQPLSEKLKSTYSIHLLNFSGHGGDLTDVPFSIEQFSTDVLHYMQLHKIEKASVFGYSMGGYVALYLAKHHPEKINRVFTLATKFLWTPEIAEREIKMLNATKIEEKLPAFAELLAKRHYPGNWKTILQKTADMMIQMGNKNPLQINDYRTIEHPVVISIGDKDAMVTLEETEDVCHQLKKANFIEFPDTQHPIEKINWERLASELKLFFV